MARNKAYPVAEKDWQAESDCHTLVEAQKIRKDPKRLAAAKKAALRKVKELEEHAATMKTLK